MNPNSFDRIDTYNAEVRTKIIRRLKVSDWARTTELAREIDVANGAARNELDRMLEAKLVARASVETGFIWALTALGRAKTTELNNTVPPRRVQFSKESYEPPSMTAARQGADDYLRIPSLGMDKGASV
jgi:predicted ArsR family transcriptional regulator